MDRCGLKNRLSTIKAIASKTQVASTPGARCHPPSFRLYFSPAESACHFIPNPSQVSCDHSAHSNARLVVLLAVEDSEDGKEQVDNVQIKRDGRSNFLFNVIMAHNELSIHQDISTEDERRHGPVDKLGSAIVGKESCHESKKDEYPQASEQVGHPIREVVFRLASEQSQSDEDASRQYESQKDNLRVVEGHNDGYGVGFQKRKAAQEKEVCRVGFAFPEGQEHESDGAEERDPHHPRIRSYPAVIRWAEVGNGADGHGC